VCISPLGEQAKVIVSPFLPSSDVAVVSQAVGFAAPFAAGGAEAGLELAGELFVWPPAVARLSFMSFEQLVVPTTIVITKSETNKPTFDRTKFFVLCEGVTERLLSVVD
jgi:hypothetical protein